MFITTPWKPEGANARKIVTRRNKSVLYELKINSEDLKHATLLEQMRNQANLDNQFSYGVVPDISSFDCAFFDMDSTLIKQESIVELAKYAGTSEEVSRLTELAMEGKLDFEQALRKRVATLEGVDYHVVDQVFGAFDVNDGAKDLVAFFKENGIASFLVSGGFTCLAEKLCTTLEMEGFYANTLEVKEGFFTGRLVGDLVDSKAKADFARKTMLQRDFHKAIGIGDGANDVPLMEYCSLAVGYSPKPVLIDYVDILNRTGDHMWLADLFIEKKLDP